MFHRHTNKRLWSIHRALIPLMVSDYAVSVTKQGIKLHMRRGNRPHVCLHFYLRRVFHARKEARFGRVSSEQVCRTDGCACSFVGLLASVKHASGKLIKPPQHVLKLCPRYAENARKRVRLLLIRLPRSRARLKLVG